MMIQVVVFWVVTLCSNMVEHLCFKEPCCLSLQGEIEYSTLYWRWRQQDPVKCWYPTTSLHGITMQKTISCLSGSSVIMIFCVVFLLEGSNFWKNRQFSIFKNFPHSLWVQVLPNNLTPVFCQFLFYSQWNCQCYKMFYTGK